MHVSRLASYRDTDTVTLQQLLHYVDLRPRSYGRACMHAFQASDASVYVSIAMMFMLAPLLHHPLAEKEAVVLL